MAKQQLKELQQDNPIVRLLKAKHKQSDGKKIVEAYYYLKQTPSSKSFNSFLKIYFKIQAPESPSTTLRRFPVICLKHAKHKGYLLDAIASYLLANTRLKNVEPFTNIFRYLIPFESTQALYKFLDEALFNMTPPVQLYVLDWVKSELRHTGFQEDLPTIKQSSSTSALTSSVSCFLQALGSNKVQTQGMFQSAQLKIYRRKKNSDEVRGELRLRMLPPGKTRPLTIKFHLDPNSTYIIGFLIGSIQNIEVDCPRIRIDAVEKWAKKVGLFPGTQTVKFKKKLDTAINRINREHIYKAVKFESESSASKYKNQFSLVQTTNRSITDFVWINCPHVTVVEGLELIHSQKTKRRTI